MTNPLATFLTLVFLTHSAFANDESLQGGKVLSKDHLPACVKTVSGSGGAPHWVVKNQCGGTIEISWCWFKALPGWLNRNNVCEKTGVLSSGLIPEGTQFAFSDRPHADSAAKFPVAAMLSVTQVCRVDSSGVCPEQ